MYIIILGLGKAIAGIG